jgi:hypothetical protein
MKLIRTPDLTYILILSSLLSLGLQDLIFPRDMKDVYHVEKYLNSSVVDIMEEFLPDCLS